MVDHIVEKDDYPVEIILVMLQLWRLSLCLDWSVQPQVALLESSAFPQPIITYLLAITGHLQVLPGELDFPLPFCQLVYVVSGGLVRVR